MSNFEQSNFELSNFELSKFGLIPGGWGVGGGGGGGGVIIKLKANLSSTSHLTSQLELSLAKVCLIKVPLFLLKNAWGASYKSFYIFFVG